MRIFFGLLVILIVGLTACSQTTNKSHFQSDKSEVSSKITFKKINGKAILMGKSVKIFNNRLNEIEEISNIPPQIVDIVEISDSLFNDTKEICKSFWYVKVQGEKINGIVNGRQVFEIQNSNQDTSFTVEGNQIEILTTDFLGMGVDYNGDLMGCPVDQPILIKDKKNNYFGLVDLIQNEYSKKASWDNEYPYFEIRSDDGCHDKIKSIIVDGTNITLKIHREFQEGENDYEVMLRYENNRYIAEYLNFGEIKYE
ncbi:hypothetical protein [Mangrovibacterium marinum]|nr:hypothetical protein [Mangrovibacterium marinum]